MSERSLGSAPLFTEGSFEPEEAHAWPADETKTLEQEAADLRKDVWEHYEPFQLWLCHELGLDYALMTQDHVKRMVTAALQGTANLERVRIWHEVTGTADMPDGGLERDLSKALGAWLAGDPKLEALRLARHALSDLRNVEMYGPADRVRDRADNALRAIDDILGDVP